MDYISLDAHTITILNTQWNLPQEIRESLDTYKLIRTPSIRLQAALDSARKRGQPRKLGDNGIDYTLMYHNFGPAQLRKDATDWDRKDSEVYYLLSYRKLGDLTIVLAKRDYSSVRINSPIERESCIAPVSNSRIR